MMSQLSGHSSLLNIVTDLAGKTTFEIYSKLGLPMQVSVKSVNPETTLKFTLANL